MGCLAHYLAQVDEQVKVKVASPCRPAAAETAHQTRPLARPHQAKSSERSARAIQQRSTGPSSSPGSLPMAAISQRVAGPCGPATATRLPGRRTAVIAAAAAKGARRARELEGASEELRATAAQCLDWAPARRRVRAAFAPVLPTLNHFLFKVRKPRCSSFGFVSCAVAAGPSRCQYLFSFTLVSV
jgi:hypothetical protein